MLDSVALECEFPIPETRERMLDTESIVVEFTPAGGLPIQFTQVASIADCTPTSFYIDATTILYPAACDAIQGDAVAELGVNFTCEPIMAG